MGKVGLSALPVSVKGQANLRVYGTIRAFWSDRVRPEPEG